jgi:hypothetical protein
MKVAKLAKTAVLTRKKLENQKINHKKTTVSAIFKSSTVSKLYQKIVYL